MLKSQPPRDRTISAIIGNNLHTSKQHLHMHVQVLSSQNQVILGKVGSADTSNTYTFDYALDPESSQVCVLDGSLLSMLYSLTCSRPFCGSTI